MTANESGSESKKNEPKMENKANSFMTYNFHFGSSSSAFNCFVALCFVSQIINIVQKQMQRVQEKKERKTN